MIKKVIADVFDFQGTPFNARTAPLNKKRRWVSWDRYHLVDVFSDIKTEMKAIRQSAALLDMSPLSQHLITGADALPLVDHLITRSAIDMVEDQVYYTPWCNAQGKVVGVGIVVRLNKNSYIITSDPMETWLAQNSEGLDVEISNMRGTYGLLALQGPKSQKVLEAATGQDWEWLEFSRGSKTKLGGIEVNVWRQGFTGEKGYEVWVPADEALTVWDTLMEAGEPFGLIPAGMHAEDVARVEAGLLIVVADYLGAGPDRSAHPTAESEIKKFVSPFEIGLGHFVDFGKEDFIGKQALLDEKAQGGPANRLVGLHIDWTDILDLYTKAGEPPVILPKVHRDPQIPIFSEERRVGHATSVTWSPTIKKTIGFGHLETEFAELRTRLSLDWDVDGIGGRVGAEVVEMPFLNLKRSGD